ncbi:MAG TPA: exodeoxyribonuclease VII large subunit, partial [Ktedonobacteraceae bacterium]|nr:exodeoxyribonuclease VII large subunit [Ktedonobacteraceae bacterium]
RQQQQLDDIVEELQLYMQHILSLKQERLRGLALRLHSLSPLLTIARGYAIVRRDRDAAIVTRTGQVQAGEKLTIQVIDGHIPVEVR